jgi:hypothetical protein
MAMKSWDTWVLLSVAVITVSPEVIVIAVSPATGAASAVGVGSVVADGLVAADGAVLGLAVASVSAAQPARAGEH